MNTSDILKIAPIRIIEGTNIFSSNLFKNFNNLFGKNPILFVKKDVYDKFNDKILTIFNSNNILEFFGETSLKEINRLISLSKNKNISSVVVMGGGKIIDTCKVLAYQLNIPIINIPTTSSTGAASSALSTIYNDDGSISDMREIVFDKACDLLVLDYDLILNSPVEHFIFGMTDALAKYYESFAFCSEKTNNIFTNIALDISTKIKLEIFKLGEKVILDFSKKKLTDDLKNILKINIILAPIVGGLGQEGCRACVSHAVNNSFTKIKSMRKFMHGEVVAFGNIIQLELDKRKNAKKDQKELLNFYKKINLMQDFTYFKTKLTKNQLDIFLEQLFSSKETFKNMPRISSKEEVLKALKKWKCF